jgi:MFS family permease
VAALGIACGVTVLLVTVFSYVAEPIARDLGLTRAQTAAALSVHLAVLIFALPAAGALADRFGARPVIIASALLFGLALLAISLVTGGQLELYAAFAIAGAAGAGVSPVTYARVVVHRFSAHRGLALGIALTGTGLGGILLPLLVQPLVIEQDWREAFRALAMVAAAAGVFAGLVLGRGGGGGAAVAAEGDTLRSAARRSVFWRMTCAFALLGAVLSGVVAHLSAIWSELHVTAITVPAFQAAMGVATIVGRLCGGALMDRMPAQWVGAGAAVVGAAGLLLLGSGAEGALLWAAAIALGLCTGAESDVISYLTSRYFGLRNFSRIYAVQGSFFMVGFALGPLIAARSYEANGTPATLFTGAVLLLGSAAILATLRVPAVQKSVDLAAVGR